jgi:hypothetical protein
MQIANHFATTANRSFVLCDQLVALIRDLDSAGDFWYIFYANVCITLEAK